RIVCFGDSITFGYGAGDDETYAFRLGRLLEARNVEVVNAGVTGFTSHQVRRLAHRLLPRLQADVATICIGWNDGNRRAAGPARHARAVPRESRRDRGGVPQQ